MWSKYLNLQYQISHKLSSNKLNYHEMIQKIIETTGYLKSPGIGSAEVGLVLGTDEYF